MATAAHRYAAEHRLRITVLSSLFPSGIHWNLERFNLIVVY
jgi:predicted acyl esterase